MHEIVPNYFSAAILLLFFPEVYYILHVLLYPLSFSVFLYTGFANFKVTLLEDLMIFLLQILVVV